MNSNDSIKWMMKQRGVSQNDLAKAIGLKRQSNVSMMLISDIKAQTLAHVAQELGFDLILQDRKSGEHCFIEYDPDFSSGRGKK